MAAALFEDRVLELTNAQRTQGGCCGAQGCFAASRSLQSDDNLRAAARLHARDMANRNFFSHVTPDGKTLSARLSLAGFAGCAAGENIAHGQRTPEEVVSGWLESDGHCANMLAGHFRHLGVGFVDDPDSELRRVWVQNFGD